MQASHLPSPIIITTILLSVSITAQRCRNLTAASHPPHAINTSYTAAGNSSSSSSISLRSADSRAAPPTTEARDASAETGETLTKPLFLHMPLALVPTWRSACWLPTAPAPSRRLPAVSSSATTRRPCGCNVPQAPPNRRPPHTYIHSQHTIITAPLQRQEPPARRCKTAPEMFVAVWRRLSNDSPHSSALREARQVSFICPRASHSLPHTPYLTHSHL